MQIVIPTDELWNNDRITLIEEPSSMGDRIKVCIHPDDTEPEGGTTVKVYKHDLIRAALMVSVEFQEEPRTPITG